MTSDLITAKLPVIRHFTARPRLTFGALLGLLCGFFLPGDWALSTRVLVSLDSGLALYLVLATQLMARSDVSDIREQATAQSAGRIAVLLLSLVTAIGSLAGTVIELSAASGMIGAQQGWHVALAGGTVLLSWLFVHTMFGIHYAHEYYSNGTDDSKEGLAFPGDGKTTRQPDYWDFIHFSFVIGVASQTADIAITSHILRRIVTLHCVVAFLFNTTVVAVTVNIAASLIG